MKKLKIFLLSLFIISSAYAAPWQKVEVFDFSGGLNNRNADVNIANNEASDLQNVVMTTGGNIKTRSGYATFSSGTVSATVACTGMKFYKKADGTKYIISVWDDDKIRKMDYQTGGGPDTNWDNITGGTTLTITVSDLSSFAIGEDTLIIEDGVGTTAPFKYTGSGNITALSGCAPNAKIVEFHKNMAFAAGDSSNLSRLYFSDIGDITDWSGGLSGNLDIETNDGTIIRGIKSGFDALYIWKDKSIWRLSGTDKDSFRLQRMIGDVGTLSHNSIDFLGSDFIFISDQGDIFLYDGAVTLQKISSKIDGTRDASQYDRFNRSPGKVFKDDYYIATTTTGNSTNDMVLMFDTFTRSWTKFKGMNINAIDIADDGTGKDMIIFGDYAGQSFKFPSGTNDNGAAISDFWQSKQFRFENISNEKYLKLIKTYANQKGNYNLTLEARSDYEGTGTTFDINLAASSSAYGTAIWGTDTYGGQNLIIGRAEPYKGKEFFQLKYSNANLDEPWEIKGFSMFIEPSDRQ